jgi:TIR domain
MADGGRFAIYISHSWRPRDVDLNLQVWHELKDDCELLVDVPEQPGANPPYYINRIEELLRRTDLFLSILTFREPRDGDFTSEDAYLKCSPFSLFEIRLAERADIPRLILFERSTGFRPPRTVRAGESYIPFDRGFGDRLPEQRQWSRVIQSKIQQWKTWASDHRKPTSYEQSTDAALIGMSDNDESYNIVQRCVRDGGYEPLICEPEHMRSSESMRALREAGLVVAELSTHEPRAQQLYAAAHAQGLPAIRMLRSASDKIEVPWILKGDPGGYHLDIVAWHKTAELPAILTPRILSMFRLSPALPDAQATDYLQSKRYSQFFVFISHTLKPPDRALVEHLYSLLKERHITPFEYHEVNTAGIDWRESLNESLQKTTHFVALLSQDYELSQTCTYELETILARGNKVCILPFMVNGRSVPNPKLAQMHNTLLENPDPRIEARIVVDQVTAALDAALSRFESV